MVNLTNINLDNNGMNVFYVADGAGAHNSIYRGKNLGTSDPDELWENIKNGTFKDLFIGDYWIIGEITYRIAAFDYYLGKGDVECTDHHAVIVPDQLIGEFRLHDDITYKNGYVGSELRQNVLIPLATTIFNSHLLKKRLYLSSKVENGFVTTRQWVDSYVDLMTEQNIWGSALYSGIEAGMFNNGIAEVDNSQYPLFAMRPDLITTQKESCWTRSIVTNTLPYIKTQIIGGDVPAQNVMCAMAGSWGNVGYNYVTQVAGIRPAFCIYQA